MFQSLTKVLFGDPNARAVKDLKPIVEQINKLEAEFKRMSDADLRGQTDEFRGQIASRIGGLRGEWADARARWQAATNSDDQVQLKVEVDRLAAGLKQAEIAVMDAVLPRAFAAVREAAIRAIGQRHFDVQLIGGMVLHQGKIAEMKTGEGKTLVATLPLYLNALVSRGCHLVTVNDYLARRDAGWMGQIYHLLGLTTGFIAHDISALYDPDYVDPASDQEDERLVHMRPCPRRLAYAADITYGTNTEFGFDYLRDNMATDLGDVVQRELYYAIIDEVDNILIDEARTPLIISGPAEESSDEYRRFARLVRDLRLRRNTAEKEQTPNGDYDLDEKTRTITLTERGIERVEDALARQGALNPKAGESLYDAGHYQLVHYLENALKAEFTFHRDKDYIIENGEVIIVDEFTGRKMPGRRWSEGLHQAVEAKEGVHVQRENVTIGTVTVQNYFRMYSKLAGMTGTAATEQDEFRKIYNLDVVVIPTNKPMIRLDHADQVYSTEDGKFMAIVAEIRERNVNGQPVLVGTTSVETSERLSQILKREGIEHRVLNAKEHTREASVVAQAGRPGTVTIATNMAGRGTDILLGGNPESLAARAVEKKMFTRDALGRVVPLVLEGQLGKARDLARRERNLTEDLLLEVSRLNGQYDKEFTDAEKVGLSAYIAAQLKANYGLDYDAAIAVMRALNSGETQRARQLVRKAGRSEALLSEIDRRWRELAEYRTARLGGPKSLAAFLTAKLFERHYNARAALIRAVLAGKLERAQELVRNTSALPAELIQDVRGVQEQWRQEQRQVVELGGLHILGTERHEARRIDNQLRGRSGRQGDPGSSQFYLSLEDELMRRFGGERVKGLMERLGVTENVPIQHNLVDRTIEGAQERVEGYNFDIRKQVLQYDDVVNRQREAIYRQRRAVLEGKGELTDRIKQYFYAEVDRLTGRYLGSYDEWMQTQIDEAIQDFTSTTTDEINVQGILRRLGTILPAAWSYDPASLEDLSGQELSRELGQHIAASRQENNHLRLLLSDVNSTFGLLPLLPAGWYNPTLAGKGDPGSLWENWSALPAWHNSITAGDVKEGREAFLKDANFVFASITNAFGAEPEADEDELAVGAEEDLWAAEDGETDDEGAESAEGDAASGDDEAPSVAEPETPTVIPAGLTDAVDQTFRAVPLLLKLPPADFGRQIETVGKKLYLAMVEAIVAAWATRTKDEVRAALCNLVDRKLARAERQIGRKEMRIFERRFLLGTIDRNWRQYLTEIDDLRQGIGLEAFGQRDPLIEFKRQGFELFQQLQDEIDRAVVYEFFRQLPYHERYVQQQRQVARAASQDYRVLQQNKGMTVQRTVKVGRNDPCPCGSGKKYKQCHGRVDQGRVPQTGGAAPARPIGKGKSPRQR